MSGRPLGGRTHWCGELGIGDIGKAVILAGWVHRRRDHGGLIFVDLRDRSGIIQAVFDPEAPEAFAKAEQMRAEYVVRIHGTVARRPLGTENEALPTGKIEIIVKAAEILNPAKTPPFYIEDGIEVDETLRLRYRYLDLRRPEMQRGLALRHRAALAVRDFLNHEGFWEIETPVLTKSTPEGARDYLVPSRLNPGRFYALPQSPQLFKQLLMVAGIERYFQIVRCFRDEDLRADRQPEFTQIDIEMSFVDSDDVINLTERLVARVCRDVADIAVQTPFPRLAFNEALDRFGTDKPDLRYGLELTDVSDIAGASECNVFKAALAGGGQVKGLRAPGCAGWSRREIDELTRFAVAHKAPGLAYIVISPEGIRSPIAKFFSQGQLEALVDRLGGQPGDVLLFVAGKPEVVAAALDFLRRHLAERLGLIPPNTFAFTWITDFPMFAFDDTEKRYVAMHHPFTSPHEASIALLETDPLAVRAKAYDLVLNGVELGGGSIRIHRRDIQERVFRVIGLDPAEAREKFGFLLEAFEYGTPPHGGIALGFDRLLMLLLGKKTIRDVMAFPKTQSAQDLMTGAPGLVAPQQLRELHIRLVDLPKPAKGAVQS